MNDDLISRRAAIDAINHICPVDTEYDCTLLDRVDVRYVLSDLPSAHPERKEGCWMTEVYEYGDGEEVADRWVEREAQRGDAAYCSVCKGCRWA